jgi:hypothetical protein
MFPNEQLLRFTHLHSKSFDSRTKTNVGHWTIFTLYPTHLTSIKRALVYRDRHFIVLLFQLCENNYQGRAFILT